MTKSNLAVKDNAITDKYLNDNLEYISKIVEAGKKRLGNKFDEVCEGFIKRFYWRCDIKYFNSNSVDELLDAALCALDFAKVKTQDTYKKLRVFNPEKATHNWKSDRTIVQCNLTDSPFILDSVINYLYRDDRTLHEVIHPIINVERDKNGNLTKVYSNDEGYNKGLSESLIHIEIGHISNVEEHKKIETELSEVLECVEFAVKDWKQMKESSKKTAERILSYNKLNIPNVAENADFLNWALDNNFIFLGYRDFDFKKDKTVSYNSKTQLGIFNANINKKYDDKLQNVTFNDEILLKNSNLIEITKSGRKSVVHRPAHMDYIGVKKYDEKGNIIGEERFLGLFTSKVYFQSAHTIPIIKSKIDNVVKKAGFRPDSHNGKALVAILESHPRDELLQSTEDELFEMGMGIVSLSEKPATRIFIRRDRFYRFYSCIIYIPREFFTTHLRNSIQEILEEELQGKVMDYYTQVTDSPLARVNVLVKTTPEGEASDYLNESNLQFKNQKVDIAKIEQRIVEKTSSWIDGLVNKLTEKLGEIQGETMSRNYAKAFPEGYKDLYHPGGATADILKIEQVYKCGELQLDFDFYKLEKDDSDYFQLKLYSLERRITLSDIMPVIENMGFSAIDEVIFSVKPRHQEKQVWIHHFKLVFNRGDLESQSEVSLNINEIKRIFEETLIQIWAKKVENDKLNQLVARAGLNAREVQILRAYGKYIIQINFPYSLEFIFKTLCKHPLISKKVLELFKAKFSPEIKDAERKPLIENLTSEIKSLLNKVQAVADDKILTQFAETIKATLRTNYFTKDKDGNNKKYLSFKLKPELVPNINKPVLFAEIFVYSYDVEGIHLRGGKVARGGLRWSDRHEDFRTEILGLVKAQMVKNSVIVPTGSKGGFVVKNAGGLSRDEYMERGKECYRTFLRGLLDITDNIIDGKTIHPENVINFDGEDPYLVVAADKGTATFSDIANGVAKEYNFWLDDAFASGGSAGYDHKKMGITARGGWVSVMRHFREMGIDSQSQDFTCVGIGDMAGDVFGNGMLQSKHIRLVGAFNHMHIFIDPTPDSAKTFKERQRLFNLPKSSWLDYNKDLISKGGGIFERNVKAIPVSQEMKELFSITEDNISPENLIKKLLTAKVDLLWNGGIGTYVKASTESHEQVGDKTNDNLRVNGNELQCKVVGEGGNLGFTQRARIEYARIGGRINTDAIDNSGGVDCSDHEVNIKIALRNALNNGKLNLQSRNKLLEEMTDEVAKLVLRDNELQTHAITIMENQRSKIIEDNIQLMENLEKSGKLDRNLEFLPSNETLHSRALAKQGLTRPELAVLLAYSKIAVFEELVNSHLPDDSYFATDLVLYFPQRMRQDYLEEIKCHKLRREIIATFVANSIVNRTGTTFFHKIREETGMKGCDVARAYTIVRDSFNLREIWDDIEKLGTSVTLETSIKLYSEIDRLIERATTWFLRNCKHPLQTAILVDTFKPAVAEVAKNLDKFLNSEARDSRDKTYNDLIKNNVPESIASRLADFDALASALDIKLASDNTGIPINMVGQVYFELGSRFRLSWLRTNARKLFADSYWDNLSLKTTINTFYDQQMKLTEDVLNKGCDKNSCELTMDKWLNDKKKQINRYTNFIKELQNHEKITMPMLTVAMERVNHIFNS